MTGLATIPSLRRRDKHLTTMDNLVTSPGARAKISKKIVRIGIEPTGEHLEEGDMKFRRLDKL